MERDHGEMESLLVDESEKYTVSVLCLFVSLILGLAELFSFACDVLFE